MDNKTIDAPLVQGNLWHVIWSMSWPLLITTVASSIVGVVDVLVAGHLGPTAQAAVGLSEHAIFLFMVFLFSVGVGTTAIVSREFGASNRESAYQTAAQALILSIIVGFALAITALAVAKLMLPFFSQSPQVIEQSIYFLGIYGAYLIPFSIVCTCNALFRSVGDAKTTLIIVLSEVAINIAGNYLTVLGNWPVPGLGIKGLAYSAIAGATIAAILALILLKRSVLAPSFNLLNRIDWSLHKRIMKIGLPTAAHRISWAASVFAVFFILGKVQEPTAALASWTIGVRLEGLLFMPLMALSLAVSSIVGQNLGAGLEARAIKAGWNVTWVGVGMMLILSCALFFGAEPLARSMTDDPTTIAFTASYLRINALAEPFLAINMILSGALQGAGDTKVPMLISMFSSWIVRLPVAWFLALKLGWGVDGVWYSMIISIAVYAAMVVVRYQSGRWIKTAV
ncbi:MAG: MATE family efflux transporter [Candidatus Obscuribacterales bacterium]|nr:MATE family efflux transporter [Candidatus Obscuribacterales bacterium]